MYLPFWSWNQWGHMTYTGSPFFWLFPFVLPLVFVELILKGFALWYAARNGQKYWFIALLVINSVGILPIVYLVSFRNRSQGPKKSARK